MTIAAKIIPQKQPQFGTKTVAIVAASDFNSEYFLRLFKSETFDLIIAADAGLTTLNKLNITPDFAIGDFDSLGTEPTPINNMQVITYPEDKDFTDLELALDKAKELQAKAIVVFGALGKRLDHELSAVQVMSKAADNSIAVYAVDMHQACAFASGPSTLEFQNISSNLKDVISVIGLSDSVTGLHSEGLKWNYDDTHISNDISIGVSNKLIADVAVLTVKHGRIVVIYSL